MRFHEMTAPRLAAVDRDQTVVLIPIAAVEQHGPHMPKQALTRSSVPPWRKRLKPEWLTGFY